MWISRHGTSFRFRHSFLVEMMRRIHWWLYCVNCKGIHRIGIEESLHFCTFFGSQELTYDWGSEKARKCFKAHICTLGSEDLLCDPTQPDWSTLSSKLENKSVVDDSRNSGGAWEREWNSKLHVLVWGKRSRPVPLQQALSTWFQDCCSFYLLCKVNVSIKHVSCATRTKQRRNV